VTKSNTDPRIVLGSHGRQHQPNGVWISKQTNSLTRNNWGLLDGEDDPETDGGLSDTANKFQGLKIDAEGPEDIDIKIATTDKEQQQEDRLMARLSKISRYDPRAMQELPSTLHHPSQP
jgi:hypothetical protein